MFAHDSANKGLTEMQSGLSELRAVGVDPAGAKESITVIRELEHLRCQLDALQLDVQAAVDRRGLHSADGHASAKVMVRHVADLSVGEATIREQSVRMRRDLPRIAEASSAGRLGIAQSRLLAKVHANVRVRQAMIDAQDWFLEQAAALNFRESQRRADALWQVFQDAAGADDSAVPPEWVHTIVWNCVTYEAMVAALDGEDVQLDPRSVMCETINGNPLDPYEAAAHSLLHKVRRLVVDAAGTVIDQGHARCFTGSARQAIKVTSRSCVWPGCQVPTDQCQIDHVYEHSSGGLTNPGNGAPLCGRHNRLKNNGFRVWRDPAGGWHTYRPDGTEII